MLGRVVVKVSGGDTNDGIVGCFPFSNDTEKRAAYKAAESVTRMQKESKSKAGSKTYTTSEIGPANDADWNNFIAPLMKANPAPDWYKS